MGRLKQVFNIRGRDHGGKYWRTAAHTHDNVHIQEDVCKHGKERQTWETTQKRRKDRQIGAKETV